jgi:hypothetical protein
MISPAVSNSTRLQADHFEYRGYMARVESSPGPDNGHRQGRSVMHCEDIRRAIEHGDHCDCKVLALAAGCDPRRIDYSYCLNVLQKRWIMECNHGCKVEAAVTADASKLHDIGSLDPVKAILISNLTCIGARKRISDSLQKCNRGVMHRTVSQEQNGGE